MNTWEYTSLSFADYRHASDMQRLDEYGKQGWELVAVTRSGRNEERAYLRRPRLVSDFLTVNSKATEGKL